jgi:hypothetical protein
MSKNRVTNNFEDDLMSTSKSRIDSLLAQRESIPLEFKTYVSQLNRDVYETVCSFMNDLQKLNSYFEPKSDIDIKLVTT